jgi:hypothetical protein
MGIGISLVAATLALTISLYSAGAQEDSVLTYHGNADRSGNFVAPGLTPEKAQSVNLDRTFNARIAGPLYAQPLYWRASGSNTAVLLVATEQDIVEAFDATTGKELWRRSVGRPVTGSLLPCGNINPLGISGRGSAIVTTTDGHSDPIVWILGAEGDNRLHAFRGDTGEPIVTSEPLTGLRHFQTLIATRDHLYIGADGQIYAFRF